jgi:predicted Zn finger-like uncharacterized protein
MAMAQLISCPSCAAQLRLRDGAAGKRIRCSKCQHVFTVPASDAPDDNAGYGVADDAAERPGPAADTPPQSSFRRSLGDAPRPGRTAGRAMDMYVERQAEALERGDDDSDGPEPSGPRRFLYVGFVVTLIPLVLNMLRDEPDVQERFARTIEAQPELAKNLTDENAGVDDLLRSLPGGKIEGAHLSSQTWIHWVYGVLATAGFLGLILALFGRGNATVPQTLWVGLFTGTAGILLLLGFQFVAEWTQGFMLRGRGVIVLLFYIVKFIGFSYRAALDPTYGFWFSFLGFTFGVGLCEEVCKALPLIFHFRGKATLNWRGALLWGLASGVGFGVSEAIHYSSAFYNGVQTGEIYVVRFVSCVALHAMWTATVAMLLFAGQSMLHADEWYMVLLNVVLLVSGPMVLHGLYDTLLKRDIELGALAVAGVSFLCMAAVLERCAAGQRD